MRPLSPHAACHALSNHVYVDDSALRCVCLAVQNPTCLSLDKLHFLAIFAVSFSHHNFARSSSFFSISLLLGCWVSTLQATLTYMCVRMRAAILQLRKLAKNHFPKSLFFLSKSFFSVFSSLSLSLWFCPVARFGSLPSSVSMTSEGVSFSPTCPSLTHDLKVIGSLQSIKSSFIRKSVQRPIKWLTSARERNFRGPI